MVFDWEADARAGLEMPEGLPSEDQTAYVQLRYLYASVEKGFISREIASREKAKITDAHRIAQFQRVCGERWVRVIRELEGVRTEYRKNPCKETADQMLNALEGVLNNPNE